jgi:hypothetical protein
MSQGPNFAGTDFSMSGRFEGGFMQDKGDLSSMVSANLMKAGGVAQVECLGDEDPMNVDVEYPELPRWQPRCNGVSSEPGSSSTSDSTEISHPAGSRLSNSFHHHHDRESLEESTDTEMKWCGFLPSAQEHTGSHHRPAPRSRNFSSLHQQSGEPVHSQLPAPGWIGRVTHFGGSDTKNYELANAHG